MGLQFYRFLEEKLADELQGQHKNKVKNFNLLNQQVGVNKM